MKILISAFKKLILLKYLFFLLLLLFVTHSLCEQFLMKKLEFSLRESQNTNLDLFFYGSLNLINSLFFPALISLFTIFYLKNPSWWFFLTIRSTDIESFIIESLRSWGKTIWWGFLFILPGFYKFLSYSYVPFIVLLEKKYDQGLVDALKESERIFLSRKWASLSTLLFFQMILPIMLSSLLDSYQNFNENPWLAILSSVLQGTLSLVGFLILMELYLQDNVSSNLNETLGPSLDSTHTAHC